MSLEYIKGSGIEGSTLIGVRHEDGSTGWVGHLSHNEEEAREEDVCNDPIDCGEWGWLVTWEQQPSLDATEYYEVMNPAEMPQALREALDIYEPFPDPFC